MVELLIVMAIIALITTVVLVRHTSFDSTIILKGEAYEIALLLRETQAKSASSIRNTVIADDDNDMAFNYPYGVSFDKSESKKHSYISFVYPDADIGVIPKNDSNAVEVGRYDLGQSIQISDLCYVFVGEATCTSTDTIDISYRRPEFKSIFYVPDDIGSAIIGKVRIKLSATRPGAGSGVFVIEVSRLGQISLYRE